MPIGEDSNQIENCLNCQQSIGDLAHFCPHCGQKVRESRISVWTLLREFFSTVFNLDSKFFKTIRHIFVPSYLPKEYMAGKRRSYINPSRFFFITLLIHFGTLALITKDTSISFGQKQMEEEVWKMAEREELSAVFDSLLLRYSISDPTILDSLRHQLFKLNSNQRDDSITYTIFSTSMSDGGYKISNYDLATYSADELFKKYDIEGFWQQLSFKQFQKMYKDPKAGFQFLIGNMLWVIVLTVIFSAFFLKLLYIRHQFYIVDHLVVSMFYHSVTLILLSIVYGIEYFYDDNSDSITIVSILLLVIIPIYGFLTMKRYYSQGKVKTFLKFLLMGFFELILLSIFATIVLLISLFIF